MLFVPLLLSVALALEPPKSITILENSNYVLALNGIKRVAIAQSKIAKVMAQSNNELILTAKGIGSTRMHVWTEDGKEHLYDVHILKKNTFDQLAGQDVASVATISLEFLEINSSFSKKIGIRLPDMIQFSGSLEYRTSGLNYSAAFSSAAGLIQHLLKEGYAKRLANPKLSVRLNEQAQFHSGGELPISSVYENYGKFHRRVEWKNYGLTIKVRPMSFDRFHIESDIQMEFSEPNASQEVDGIPSLTKRNLETKMNSKDGETVILSGLIRELSSSQKDGFPVLSSIPILGSILFSAKGENTESTEMMMAITIFLAHQDHEGEELEKLKRKYYDESPH